MKISIVIPAHNEEGNISELHQKITKAFGKSALWTGYEIIWVNDSSTDSTLREMKKIGDKRNIILNKTLRDGQSFSIKEGIEKAKHPIIVTMDADLQNDPKDIEKMLLKIVEGADFVCGNRKERKDPLVKILCSKAGNAIIRKIFSHDLHDIGCAMRVFRKECVSGIEWFDTSHTFLPLLVRARGFRVEEVEVRHHPRASGKSKYGVWNRVFRVINGINLTMKAAEKGKAKSAR